MEVWWFGPQPRRFTEPLACLTTDDLAGVMPALARAEEALAQGYDIAGYLTYEAGAAFVEPEREGGGIRTAASRAAGAGTSWGTAARHESGAPPQPLVALGVYHPESVGRDETASESATARRGHDGDDRGDEGGADPDRDELGPLVAQIDAARYEADLAAIARALYTGDVYQANYTVPFAFAFSGDPSAIFERMRARARVPYAAFVRHGDRALLSLSPERFFEIDGDRLRARPMKGTSGPHAPSDLRSEKNRAEHVMIVDLLRNDMHRVCTRVDVDPLFAVETYPTFATMTSTLEGRLRDDARLRDVFAALFPCGSITGAPKRRAMREIARLEAAPRGIAMGTIGYCDGIRRGQWSVAIRTASLDTRTGCGELRVGGGIVADSTAATEWAEVLVKRRAFADLAARVGLIETLRVEIDGTLASLDAHLQRLARSAFALGIPHDDACVARALADARVWPRREAALLRLELDPKGSVSITERALEAPPTHPTIAIAPQRLRSSDPALRYKTTARAAYDAAGSFARAHGCFDALVRNERGELADGARTTLFVETGDGTFLTPSLAAGALAGIFRARSIVMGRTREATLFPGDLVGRRVYVGNDARGLMEVTVVDTDALEIRASGKAPYGLPRHESLR